MGTTERVKEFIEYKGVSKYEFCKKLGFSNKFLDNSSNMGTDKACKILHYYPEINAEWLLTGIGTMEKPNVQELSSNKTMTKTMTFSEETKHKENVILLNTNQDGLQNRMPQVVTVDGSGKDNVVLVPAKAAAGYLLGYGDNKFIESLPTFNLPNINNGTFRMFQVSGHSMFPTISDGSYVVGEWVENWVKEVKDNRIYVIISTDGILIKRVLNRLKKYDNLYLKSDNRREYPNISLLPSQIKEIWSVKMHLSFELPDPTVLYDRVGDLEAEIEHIKSTIKAKN